MKNSRHIPTKCSRNENFKLSQHIEWGFPVRSIIQHNILDVYLGAGGGGRSEYSPELPPL